MTDIDDIDRGYRMDAVVPHAVGEPGQRLPGLAPYRTETDCAKLVRLSEQLYNTYRSGAPYEQARAAMKSQLDKCQNAETCDGTVSGDVWETAKTLLEALAWIERAEVSLSKLTSMLVGRDVAPIGSRTVLGGLLPEDTIIPLHHHVFCGARYLGISTAYDGQEGVLVGGMRWNKYSSNGLSIRVLPVGETSAADVVAAFAAKGG